jgi:hypothetical protein
MALDQSALLELTEALRTSDGGDLMRRLLQTMLQALVDAEATAHIGAGPHERTATRTTQRNGSRDKLVASTAGDLTVKIPKVRAGSFFPSLLAPRRRIDVALHAVVMQAWVEGVSTRKVDDLVAALGVESGISKSEVSRICAQLDAEVATWRSRPLGEIAFPYVFLDATYCKARVNGRVVSRAVVIATGVSADGRREVLGCAVGDSETEAFWTEFLRDLRERGLHGVQLVISDQHRGLVNAVAAVLQGAAWQRSSVNITGGGMVPLVTSAAGRGPWQRDRFRSSGRPVPPGGGGSELASGSSATSTWMSVQPDQPRRGGACFLRRKHGRSAMVGVRWHRLGWFSPPAVHRGFGRKATGERESRSRRRRPSRAGPGTAAAR